MPYIRNSHSSTIQVVGMYWDPQACGQHGNYRTMGWWRIKPYERLLVAPNNAQFFYWYAESDDGFKWEGRYGPAYTYLYPFDSCLGIGSTGAWKTVTMRQHDQHAYPGGVNVDR
ncbi:hypothetical protein WKI68_02645 [Streptomyces sp. MS1.HAVA.3]|uniref:DUF1036 domain-containing protein n=1 Tax=Streptomyces caledonius TaxID=3134107 RepID=A0ABU8TYE9_9ACTN